MENKTFPVSRCAIVLLLAQGINPLTNNSMTRSDYGKTIIDVGFQHENRGCEDGMIPYGVCENENDQQQKGVRLVGTLPACTFPVNVEDVVFGIWHSLNTEESLIPQLQVRQRL